MDIQSTLPIDEIRRVVLDTLVDTNLTRPDDRQLGVGDDAPVFGPGSSLDSLGLVALLIDLEDRFRDAGMEITFADAHSMSEVRSPFRDVPSLVDYVARQLRRT